MNYITTQPAFSGDNSKPTMTSLELVEFINRERKAGEAELRHDNFMAKVPKVLGNAAPKFLGADVFINGTGGKVERTIYRLPKREACLMAMSYSYEIQAKVFDRMTELEEAVKKIPTQDEYLNEIRNTPAVRCVNVIAETFQSLSAAGFGKLEATQMAVLAANHTTGILLIDFERFRKEQAEAAATNPAPATRQRTTITRAAYARQRPEGYLDVAQLAKHHGLSIENANIILVGRRYQAAAGSGEYELTPKGKRFGKVFDSTLLWRPAAIS